MKRKIKFIGLVLAATASMSVVFTSTATATPFDFYAANDGTTEWHGDGDQWATEWLVDSGKVSCLKATYKGFQSGTTSTTMVLAPTYTECHIIVLFTFKVTVDTEGCTYRFKTVTFEKGAYEGTTDLLCPVGKQVKVTAPGCTITIPSQSNLKNVTYTNLTETNITTIALLSGMTYVEDDSGLCANNGVLQHDGSFQGRLTIKGMNTANESWVDVGLNTT